MNRQNQISHLLDAEDFKTKMRFLVHFRQLRKRGHALTGCRREYDLCSFKQSGCYASVCGVEYAHTYRRDIIPSYTGWRTGAVAICIPNISLLEGKKTNSDLHSEEVSEEETEDS